jgi:hypothetical protein
MYIAYGVTRPPAITTAGTYHGVDTSQTATRRPGRPPLCRRFSKRKTPPLPDRYQARPQMTDTRAIIAAIFYFRRSGCK